MVSDSKLGSLLLEVGSVPFVGTPKIRSHPAGLGILGELQYMGRAHLKYYSTRTNRKPAELSKKAKDHVRSIKSLPSITPTNVRDLVDVKECFLVEADPDCPEKYFKLRTDLIEALKRVKRINKRFAGLGKSLVSKELEEEHKSHTQAVFNHCDDAIDHISSKLGRVLVQQQSK